MDAGSGCAVIAVNRERPPQLLLQCLGMRLQLRGVPRQGVHVVMQPCDGLIPSFTICVQSVQSVTCDLPVEFVGKRDHCTSVFQRRAMNRHSQKSLPPLSGAHATLDVVGDFFPAVENLSTH